MNKGSVHTALGVVMESVESVTYLTADGGLTVSYSCEPLIHLHDGPEWVVVVAGQEHRFLTVAGWLGFVRDTYGWPLTVVGAS